jgi:phosphoribosylformimino-5-aminoimidazole carboxamide ribotide isomerase
MTLERVGAGEGPDLDRVAGIVERAGSTRRVSAAGGERTLGDLQAPASKGAAGQLVATALHSGAIGAKEIKAVA